MRPVCSCSRRYEKKSCRRVAGQRPAAGKGSGGGGGGGRGVWGVGGRVGRGRATGGGGRDPGGGMRGRGRGCAFGGGARGKGKGGWSCVFPRHERLTHFWTNLKTARADAWA